jgi:hypothetical protein
MNTGLLYKADAEGARILWLLTVQWAGHTIRIADDEVDVQTDAGDWLHYEDGLGTLAVEEEITLGGDAGGLLSVPLEVAFPALVNVPLLVARGHRLSTARGELARWVEGTPWESRRRVVVGRFVKPSYRGAGAPIRTSLDESLFADQSVTHALTQRVIGANWEHIDTVPIAQLGEYYPIVIGRPGFVSTDIASSGWITGSGGTWIDARNIAVSGSNFAELRVLIAGHHVQAGSVYVNADDYTAGARVRVYNGFDDQGAAVAWLSWFAASIAPGAPEDDYDSGTYTYSFASGPIYGLGAAVLPFNLYTESRLYIGWRDEDDLSAGGLVVGGALVRAAGPVLSYLLGMCASGVDRGAMAAVGPLLSRFNFDGVIDSSARVWDILKREILPLLPVSLASGPSGYFVHVWRLDATRADATLFIDTASDPDIELLGDIEEEDEDQVNRIVIRYAFSYRTQTYTAEIVLGAAGDMPSEDASGSSFRVSPYCQASRDQLGGEVRERVIETAFVYETSTAWAIAEFIATAYALPARRVTWRLPEGSYIGARRAAVALLSDEETFLEEEVALVTGVVTDGSGWITVTTRVVDQPGKLYRGA